MLAFLACAIVMAGSAVWKSSEKIPDYKVSEVIEGKWMPLYEDTYNKALPVYNISKNLWGAFNYAAFREGNEGVVIGDDNWLFTSEEFDNQPGKAQRLQEKLTFVLAVDQHLSSHGTKLLIVPVPSKARIYEAKLGRYHFPSYKKNIYAQFLNGLKALSLNVVDIHTPMRDVAHSNPMFLRTDTHWTVSGAKLTALEVAKYIGKNMPDLEVDKMSYKTIAKKPQHYDGDLMRYIPVGDLSYVKGDIIDVVETQIAAQAALDDKALFSDNTPEITLVGTSYSANPQWNFEGYLKEYLQADVLNAASEGLGPFETMQKYLNNSAFKETPPKLVIWEIPERYLLFTYNLQNAFNEQGN